MFLTHPLVGRGQPPVRSVEAIPPIERQAADFYGAIAAGGRVTAAWSVEPAAVPLGGDILLTLTVRGAANPAELARPDLRTRPEFGKLFQITDEPPPPPAAAGEARFIYRLRPRAAGEVRVPSLRYGYYQPGFREGKRMTATYADPVPLTVLPPAAPPPGPPVPLDAPEEFFALPSASAWGLFPAFATLPVAAALLAAGGWAVAWRLWFPDAARVRRTRAARTALAHLAAARRSADPAAGATLALRGYFSARYGVPPHADTPAEVAAALAAAGRPSERAEAFLRAADAARFAPDRDTGLTLVDRAERLITLDAGGPA